MATQMTVAQQRRTEAQSVVQTLGQMAPQLRAALPAHVTVEKFTRVAANAIQGNPDLLNADRGSLFQACLKLAADGLMPDGRDAAIVVFAGKAQAMPMIAGILRKLRQSGEVAKISAQVVYENDEFVWHLGFDEDVTHNPPKLDQPRGKAIGAYATAVLKDGSRLLEVMSLEEIEKVRAVSRAAKNGPWVAWWGEMARKTVMRRLSKRLPMSSDMEDAFERDDTMRQARIAEAPPANDAEPMSKLDALEYHLDEESLEGRDLTDHGESRTTTDRAAVVMHQLDACETVAAVNSYVAAIDWAELSDDDAADVRAHAAERVVALGGGR